MPASKLAQILATKFVMRGVQRKTGTCLRDVETKILSQLKVTLHTNQHHNNLIYKVNKSTFI